MDLFDFVEASTNGTPASAPNNAPAQPTLQVMRMEGEGDSAADNKAANAVEQVVSAAMAATIDLEGEARDESDSASCELPSATQVESQGNTRECPGSGATGGEPESVAKGSPVAEAADALDADAPDEQADTTPGYTRAWRRFCARLLQVVALCSAIEGETQAAFGTALKASDLTDQYDLRRKIEAARTSVFGMLVSRAQDLFGVPGSRLSIDTGALREQLGRASGYEAEDYYSPRSRRRRHAETESQTDQVEDDRDINDVFDPDAVWRWLEENYGGEKGEELAREQLAKQLVSTFSLERSPPVMVGGRLKLQMWAYSEEKFSGKGRHYSFSALESIRKALLQLAAFAHWADDFASEHALKFSKYDGLDYHGTITSRERLNFGEVELVTFHKNIDVLFSPKLSEKFRMFIAQYGQPSPD